MKSSGGWTNSGGARGFKAASQRPLSEQPNSPRPTKFAHTTPGACICWRAVAASSEYAANQRPTKALVGRIARVLCDQIPAPVPQRSLNVGVDARATKPMEQVGNMPKP